MPFSQHKNTVKRVDKRYPKEVVSVGDHIRKRRLDLKLTQKAAAARIGITVGNIGNWESNKNEPTIQYAPYIIAFLGYDPYSSDTTTLGGRIQEYRYMNGLSQTEFATLLDTDANSVSNWERNIVTPHSKHKEKLRKYISV